MVKKKGLDIEECKLIAQCEGALLLWTITIDRTDFFNEAASGALNLNPHILVKYVA